MSDKERTGKRDLLYSQWHRRESTRRYVGERIAWMLGQIDIDWCEYCRWCSEPVALIETQESSNGPKSASVTSRLAARAEIQAFSVAYQRTDDGDDIESFDVQQLVPAKGVVKRMSPKEYAYWLFSLRDDHNAVSPSCARKTFNNAGHGELADHSDPDWDEDE